MNCSEAYERVTKAGNFDIENSPFLLSSTESSYTDLEDLHFDPFLGKDPTKNNENINDLLEDDSTNS